ncbi:uncharacterized protein N7515_005840 [Penicillium bovifimosum]|uniref:Uncharacterized protein n=1 Tax=Penicillium bovifimosum TaxID=126998 RepID=A0A9W9L072_9EURO|nr:uncharacterized protein N7515_005840 [Penicillium bovifimosum]KAJ5129801.1 hypothetical protein N7515_005840 [Penicillium bovifimosum]
MADPSELNSSTGSIQSAPASSSFPSAARLVHRLPALKQRLQEVAVARANDHVRQVAILVRWLDEGSNARHYVNTMASLMQGFVIEHETYVLRNTDRMPNWRLRRERVGHIIIIGDVSDHLFACRVLRTRARSDILPVLSEHLPSSLDLRSYPEIEKFLDGPTRSHLGLSEHHLVRDPTYGISLGQVWGALAIFEGSKKRRGIDSSKVPSEGNDNELEASLEQPRIRSEDEGEPSPKRRRHPRSPEDYTVRHTLYFAPPQDGAILPAVLEFRDAKSKLSAHTP